MATVPPMPWQLDVEDDVVLLAPEEETVPEHDVHRVLVDLLAAGLVALFADRDDVAVFCRLAWFPDRDDTRVRLDPDVMVVFGRPPGPRKRYKAWMEGGVSPAVLVEVWSDDDTDADYRRRLGRARRYGVEEVVIVDPFAPGGAGGPPPGRPARTGPLPGRRHVGRPGPSDRGRLPGHHRGRRC